MNKIFDIKKISRKCQALLNKSKSKLIIFFQTHEDKLRITGKQK